MGEEIIKFKTRNGDELNLICDLDDSIGEGSIATVYEVSVEGSNEKLALKILDQNSYEEIKKEFEEKSNYLLEDGSPFSEAGFVEYRGFQKIMVGGQEKYALLMQHGGTSLYDLVKEMDELKKEFSSQLDESTKEYLIDKNMYRFFLNLEKLHEKETHNDLSLDNTLLGFDIRKSLMEGTLDKDLFENDMLMTDPIPINDGNRSKTKELSESKYRFSEDFLREPFGGGLLENRDRRTKKRIIHYKKSDIDASIMIYMFLRQGEDAFDDANVGEYGDFLFQELGESFGTKEDLFNSIAARRSTRNIPSAKQIRIALQEKIKKKYFHIDWEGNNPDSIIEKIYRPIDKLMEECDKLISKLEDNPDYSHNDLNTDLKGLIENKYNTFITWKDHSGNPMSPEVKSRMNNYLIKTIDSVTAWVGDRKTNLTKNKKEKEKEKKTLTSESNELDNNISKYKQELNGFRENRRRIISLIQEMNEDSNYDSSLKQVTYSKELEGSTFNLVDSYSLSSDLENELSIRNNLKSDQEIRTSVKKRIESKEFEINNLNERIKGMNDITKYLSSKKGSLR